MNIKIRRAVPADIPAVFRLIQELAVYERASDQVENTPEQLLADGFGENPAYSLLVAEHPQAGVIGISLCYVRYSTWRGRCLYLEDLVVNEAYRRQGIGKQLFLATKEMAKQQGMSYLVWQALDWNQPALEFYQQQQAEIDGEWVNCRLALKPA